MTINKDGDVEDYTITPSIINSKYKNATKKITHTTRNEIYILLFIPVVYVI